MIQRPSSLKFLDYIKSLSSPWVFEYFLQKTDSLRKILSVNIIEIAVSNFIQPDTLVDRFRSLEITLRINCALVYLFGNSGMVCDLEDPFEHPLVRSFLVFAADDQNGDTKLFGFDEFESTLRNEMITIISEHGVTEKWVNMAAQWKWRQLNDITIVASAASQGELKKTRNGRLARTTIQKLKRLTDYASADMISSSGDIVPRIMVAYGVASGFLQEEEMSYTFVQDAFERWMSLSLEERHSDCSQFATSFLGRWRLSMLQDIFTAAGNSLISLKFIPEQDMASVIDSIKALRFAGVVEYKCLEGDLMITKAKLYDTSRGTESTALVQADFSAVIVQETDPDIIYTFTQLGELLSLDKVYNGKIDKTIVSNALSRGFNSELMIDWLNKRQAPSNVIETVREWIREFFRLYIADCSILVSGDEKVSGQIESYEPLRNHLEVIRANTIYQIKRGHENQVKEILGSIGFDYRKAGENRENIYRNEIAINEAINYSDHWRPVTEQRAKEKKQSSAIRGTKYGEELKALDISEIIHVIDYAVLTGRNLTFDYEGSPYLKPGVYTVLPLSCRKGMDPVLEAEMLKTKTKKQFYIKKIKKIGVTAE